MKRYRISTLLFVVASFAVGWWFRGFTIQRSTENNLERIENAKTVAQVLASSSWINKLIEESRGDAVEREIRFHNHLIVQIYDLARFEPLYVGNAPDLFVMHGSHSLRHLNVASVKQLREIVEDARLVDSIKHPFTETSHAEYALVRDFVSRCLNFDTTPLRYDIQ